MTNLLLGIALKVGVNPILLLSICQVETGLKNINNYNDNKAGSYGVAQIQVRTARGIDPSADILALQIPEANIKIAAKLLKKLTKKYNDPWKAVAVYNAGSLKYRDGILINQKYVDNVKRYYYNYEKTVCLYRRKNDKNQIQKGKWNFNYCKADTV